MHDTANEIRKVILDAIETEEYDKMKTTAQEKGPTFFSYRNISRKCIEG